ncbi:hypothetical protein Y032_0019g3921 [Ancylostoma ceylanicum]|nr:hypothetical protein Y032_0019g3921 [Ancylostoma ceylanicum]
MLLITTEAVRPGENMSVKREKREVFTTEIGDNSTTISLEGISYNASTSPTEVIADNITTFPTEEMIGKTTTEADSATHASIPANPSSPDNSASPVKPSKVSNPFTSYEPTRKLNHTSAVFQKSTTMTIFLTKEHLITNSTTDVALAKNESDKSIAGDSSSDGKKGRRTGTVIKKQSRAAILAVLGCAACTVLFAVLTSLVSMWINMIKFENARSVRLG